MESFTSLWWYTWVVLHKPLVAEKIEIQKPLMAGVDRRSQVFGGTSGRYRAFGGRGNRLQAFGGRSFTVVHESLVANGVDDY